MLPRNALLISLASLPLALPEIIDRIAVVVGNGVITASEIVREVRLTDFQNGEKLDLSLQAKRKAAERLIEQRLIRRELELTRYPTPPLSEADNLLKRLKQSRFENEPQYREALSRYGITEADLKDHLYWQLTAMRFIDMRFRPGIQVTDEDVERELELRRKPKGNGAPQPAALDDDRTKIREELIEQRVDQQVDAWLKSARERTRIEFRQEALA